MILTNNNWLELNLDTRTGIETLRAHFSGHAYDPHWHDCYLIGVTEQGVQQFNCRKQKHSSIAGSCFLLEPCEIHDGQSKPLESFTYRMLYIPTQWLETQLNSLFEQYPSNFELSISATLSNDKELATAVSHAFLALHLKENRMLQDASLDRMLEVMTKHLSWRKAAVDQPIQMSLAYRAKEYIECNLETDIGLEDMATALLTNRFQLSRAFNKQFNISPHAYLIQLRLVEARRLLAMKIPVADVATQLCFSDQSHLGRWFKRAYQLTPAKYSILHKASR